MAPGSWSGSHIRWGQAFRLRHLTTGHYLALTEDKGLVLQDRERSDTVATAFCFRASKVRTFYLKVTCVSHGLNHSLTRSLRHLWGKKKKSDTGTAQSHRTGKKISVFHRTMGIMGAVKAKVVEVNLAELADQIEHLPSLCVMEFSRCDQRLRGN